MYYDLHIHSALSPCGDDTMTINNIFNMAYIKGLQLIAITDHNSLRQQYYLEDIIQHDILKGKIDYIHGVELQSRENIHILAYFQKDAPLDKIQSWIEQHLPHVLNQPDYYGYQYIFNQNDEIVETYDYLLLQSLDLDVYQIIDSIHELGGIAVLAHVMAKRFGIYEVYQGIPSDLDYDGIEVTCEKDLRELKKKCPDIRDDYIFYNSDAHYLESISEPFHEISQEKINQLWRRVSCKK